MIIDDLQRYANIKNPSLEDYKQLLGFTETILHLFQKERKSRSAINKKRNKLVTVNRDLNEKLKSLGV